MVPEIRLRIYPSKFQFDETKNWPVKIVKETHWNKLKIWKLTILTSLDSTKLNKKSISTLQSQKKYFGSLEKWVKIENWSLVLTVNKNGECSRNSPDSGFLNRRHTMFINSYQFSADFIFCVKKANSTCFSVLIVEKNQQRLPFKIKNHKNHQNRLKMSFKSCLMNFPFSLEDS